MQFEIITLVAISANVLGSTMAIPQAAKILRSGHSVGVSPSWAAISTVLNAWWGIYAIGVGDWGIFPVATISVMAYLVIAVAMVRFARVARGRIVSTMLTTSLACGAVPLLAAAVGGWVGVGLALGALYGIQLAPAVLNVYRCADVSGVSVATWALAFGEAALWGAYGLANADVGLIALAVTGVSMSSLVLARLLARRPRRDRRVAGLRLAPA
jgi:uncharacterized protein with PQ loop repeat